MDVIKSLCRYKPIPYYVWLGLQVKVIPKQIWGHIIKLVLEGKHLRELLAHISINESKIWVRLQPTEDIFSTLYIKRGTVVVNHKGEGYRFHYWQNKFELNEDMINLEEPMYDVCLLHDDQIVYQNNLMIGDCPVKCVDGLKFAHGVGRIFNSDFVYVGDIAFRDAHGWGRFYWKNGCSYVGQVNVNHMSGHGTYYFSDGSKYVGEFLDDTFDGWGRIYNKEGQLLYEGQHKAGAMTGQGTLYLEVDNGMHGSKYIGQMVEGHRHGFGECYDDSGQLIYSGYFEHGVECGHAIIYFNTDGVCDGSKYVGQIVNGEKHGYGKYYDKDGNLLYEGQYEHDIPSGYETVCLELDDYYNSGHGNEDEHDNMGNLFYSGQYVDGVGSG